MKRDTKTHNGISTCECKGNSQIIFGSVKDFTLPMFEDWAHNLKSYNCTWVDTVEESSTVTPRTKKEAQQSTTLSSLPGEDAIFNFFSEPWWNGTQTFSGNQSCVEECIKVPM
jgi:hypothetical protein